MADNPIAQLCRALHATAYQQEQAIQPPEEEIPDADHP
jgi:hypothetical protein